MNELTRMVKLAEHEYSRTFTRWQHTPRWKLIQRARRQAEWKLWLRALFDAVEREARS